MMHPGKRAGYPLCRGSNRMEEYAIDHVRFFSLPEDCSSEMYGDGLGCVLGNVGLKDRLKDNAYRVGKAGCRVGHLWKQPGNASCPYGAPHNGAPARGEFDREPNDESQ